MRHAARGCLSVVLLAASLSAPGAEATEQDQFEDKCITRAAERVLKASKSDHALWKKALEAVYPGKVVNPTTGEEYAKWYELLAGKNEEWRRADAPNEQVTALFDKVVQRLELGPVPAVTRDEFLKFARRALMKEHPHGEPPTDVNGEADKVFRVLDKNLDGELDREELTTALKDERARVESDGNGRISKIEYRAYFQRKVEAKVKVLAAKEADAAPKPDEKAKGKPAAKPANALPDWFATLDTDNDKQISLYEWRAGGRPIALFQEMDLNGDGLLTPEEYLRWVKKKEIEENQRKREEGK
jgi:Ca2+-binding EF-hand superfamily protein